MICKYCHLSDHVIDDCPTIICKRCKEIGHPQWLCTEKKNNNFKLEKKYQFSEDIKKNNVTTESFSNKNIEHYLKLEKKNWSEFII